jgi:PAS domain S-box-containing protein
MTWLETIYVILMIATAVVSAVLALSAARRRPTPGATPLAVLMLGVAVWSLGYALQLTRTSLPANVFWGNVKYVGIVTIPAAWLCFALQYTGRGFCLTRRNLALLALHPATTLLLVWTNDLHGLIWHNVRLDANGSFPVRLHTYGAGFWLHTGYSYLLLLLGTIILVRSLVRAASLYHGQAWVALAGVTAPLLGNLLYVSDLGPLPDLDLTPFTFTLTGLAMMWGLLRFRLLDIIPIARDTVIERMGDAVVVIDVLGRIVDLNLAAQRILGYSANAAIGWPASQIFADHTELVKRYNVGSETSSEITLRPGLGVLSQEEAAGEKQKQRQYDLRISSLTDQDRRLAGWVVVLRDITARKQAERTLRESHDELERRVQERTTELAATNKALQVQVTERTRAEQQLRVSLEEKEALLKEIHHRVKNNLQIISSLLSLQAGTLNDQETVEIFQESQHRVRSMGLIHEKLYQSRDLAKIDFAGYAESLSSYLFHAYGVNPDLITLRINVKDVFLSIGTAIPCGLIINELVSNALKYAFPASRAGEIYIAMYSTGDKFTLLVGDDGVGLPQEWDLENTGTLGLQLVYTLARQLQGTIKLDRNGGTKIVITFGESRQHG